MKKYFIFAAVALVALCNVSCSSSDDDDEPFNPTVKYDEPAAASAATAFAIPTVSQPTATDGTNTTKLQQVDITESGKTVVKVDFNGSAKYLTFDSKYSKEGNKEIYKLFKDNVQKGKIESTTAAAASRRALNLGNLKITLVVEIPNADGTTTTANFGETTVSNATQIAQVAATTNAINICRTWTVETMTMTLKDKKAAGTSSITDCTVNVNGGNLKELADKAQENKAGLTDKEYQDLCKFVNGITLTKAGQLSIEYSTGLTDACQWAWGNKEETVVTIKSEKGEDFGNKFLNDNSKIAVKFYEGGKAHFSVTTTIDNRTGGNNKYFDATIDFTLK